MPVNDILRLTLDRTSVPLGTPTAADFAAGYRDVSGAAVTARVKANRAFRLQVSGATPSFSYAGSAPNPAKPASDLRWATSPAALATTTSNMGTPGTLLNQGATANAQRSLYLRTLWDFVGDVPGTYSLVVSFTLSAP